MAFLYIWSPEETDESENSQTEDDDNKLLIEISNFVRKIVLLIEDFKGIKIEAFHE